MGVSCFSKLRRKAALATEFHARTVSSCSCKLTMSSSSNNPTQSSITYSLRILPSFSGQRQCMRYYIFFTALLCASLTAVRIVRQTAPSVADWEVRRYTPLIFVGGVPRSGTTLMRALLDAHDDVRCGEETRVIPRILSMFAKMKPDNSTEGKLMQEAGVTDDVLASAVGAFILEVVQHHGTPAERLCNKDPLNLIHMTYLSKVFANSKYIFMIRDGRAVVHSVIDRHVTIGGWDLSNFTQCMQQWDQWIEIMYEQCEKLGDRCFPMYYEQLILHSRKQMETLLRFLEIPWSDKVLNHEELVGTEISVSKLEPSTDQIARPINVDALTKWVGNVPVDLLPRMGDVAPMLSRLGYDPYANPPDYGKPDQFVLDKTQKLRDNIDIYNAKWTKNPRLGPQGTSTPTAPS